LEKELLLQCNKRKVLHGNNMQETMLPARLHLQAKHTCEVSLSLSTLNLAVQSVAQHEREATSDDLQYHIKTLSNAALKARKLHSPATDQNC